MSKKYGPSVLGITDHRGFATTHGPGIVLSGDDVTAQANIRLGAAQYSYVSQDAQNIGVTAGRVTRYGVSAGLQYYLPRLHGK